MRTLIAASVTRERNARQGAMAKRRVRSRASASAEDPRPYTADERRRLLQVARADRRVAEALSGRARTILVEPHSAGRGPTAALLAIYDYDRDRTLVAQLAVPQLGRRALPYWGFMAIYARLRNRLRAKGIEAPIVQQLAGHKSIATTQLYIGRMQKSDILRRVPRAFTATYGRAI